MIGLTLNNCMTQMPIKPEQALMHLPVGSMVMWIKHAGTNIPKGWIVCDGSHGTPKPDMKVQLANVKLPEGSTACLIKRVK